MDANALGPRADLAVGTDQDETGIVGVHSEHDRVLVALRADHLATDELAGFAECDRHRRLSRAAAAEIECEECRRAACSRVGCDGRHACDDEVELLDRLGGLHASRASRRVPALTDGEDQEPR